MIYTNPRRVDRFEVIAATVLILLGASLAPAICAAWTAGAHHTFKGSH